ncbi:MAG: histidine phosphatase family protein [Flavobacteriales bacterium]|nr:histidine phosphatase family protein [Flavobacteriales bacterium]
MLRHAKSSWADTGTSDFDRPLNDRGQHDAPMMAKRFAERKETMDIIVTSPALRAKTTAAIFAKELGLELPRELQELYLASAATLLATVQAFPKSVKSAMVVGHNPGLSLLADDLAEGGLGDLPTCALIRIDFNADSWSEVSNGTGKLEWWDTPKQS